MDDNQMALVERANAGLHSHVERYILDKYPEKNLRILDIGCGTGAFLSRLKGDGYTKLNGIDIDLSAANIDGISFSCIDLDSGKMPYEDSSFDLIICIEVLEHIENVGIFLSEISRILSEGGNVVVTTPNVHSLEARLRNLLLGKLKQFDEIGDPTHIYPVFLFPFRRIARRYKLEIAELWGFPLDGISKTSRGVLQIASKLLKAVGLKANPPGDQLCMRICHSKNAQIETIGEKRDVIASHYKN
jgi:2-polyprenyl-3-methyl-5-hydroxy-6-metoxy-1,4-benzoquinol methylase